MIGVIRITMNSSSRMYKKKRYH